MADLFLHERNALQAGHVPVAGVDEAGRGPLAGPVVAAAVVLPLSWLHDGLPDALAGLIDSKQLSEPQRERFFEFLCERGDVHRGVGVIDHATIDRINILKATHAAMAGALDNLPQLPRLALVDGKRVNGLPCEHVPIVKGDALSYSIAAASVIAKVTRDRLMVRFDSEYPGYGFSVHKGYGTPDHLEALRRLGPCPIHRRSFAPLRPSQGELF